jgi:hypothetical protein
VAHRIGSLTNGYQFVECCDLSHIGLLIEKHWSVFSSKFISGTQPLSLNDFQAKFNRVREARNDIYHLKSLARMTGVVNTAEDLLDYLNFSLGFVCEKITGSGPVALKFNIAAEVRHQIWWNSA